jgi:hypothetical protein
MDFKQTCTILVAKFQGKRPLWISRRRRNDNIKTDLKATVYGCVDWNHPAQENDGINVQTS